MEVENPYNNPASVKARKDQEDPWMMYLIVRKSLGMSAGKIAAQCGHCVGIMYGRYMKLHEYIFSDTCKNEDSYTAIQLKNIEDFFSFESWQKDSFRKIVLKADDNKWEKLKVELECYVVRDAGLTEIASGSETCMVIWPLRKSTCPEIIRHLQLL